MSTVLYIKANSKPVGTSRTFKISDQFIEMYKENNPNDDIITLDLYQEDINFLLEHDMNTIFGAKTEDSRNHPVLKYAYQFAEADKYVVAEPMWNLSVPAILKAYIDYITVTGISFEYKEQGPVGLLTGKKAVNIVSRGGNYSSEPASNYEMGDRYLRTIFGFFGITDFTTIAADNLDMIGQDVEAILDQVIINARDIAKTF